ncbi:MAG: ABC transporter permease subunit [Cytophagales bacterium]|nr:ABC transporter permease subunit [Cytophagales bacterium]MDW8383220.1 ABC transporter permease subunit [Flammeovirgaceae bacterium]
MRSILTIAKREFAVFFDSLIGYVLLVAFLGISGFFTWLYGNTIFIMNQANLQVFFAVAYWTLFFFIPAITMRTLAEEMKTGTIELLLTKAVSENQLILGKYLSCMMLIAVALVATLPYYFTIEMLGDADKGAVFGGYIGLFLLSSAYVAIGIFASSLTNNQIVAFLISLFVGLFFHLLFEIISANFTGNLGKILNYFSASQHFESLGRGVIDSRDIVFFVSLTALGLYLAQWSVMKRIRFS